MKNGAKLAEFRAKCTRRALKSMKKSVKRKGKTIVRNLYDGTRLFQRRTLALNTQRPIVNLKAPRNFSLINNADETLAYLNKARREFRNGNRVHFDISNVSTLTTDAIAVLIAKVKDPRFHLKRGIMGNAPKDEGLKKLFVESGFFDYVISGRARKTGKKLMIHKVTKNKVEPVLAKEACLVGIKHSFHNSDVFEPIYDILIEIMQNTNNHAGSIKGRYDWWLNIYNRPESRVTAYTFLDLGVGIFESLPVKSFFRSLLEVFGVTSNLDLIEHLFAGEIKSRTGRPERGKGIPQVYECSQHPSFSKFILISNNIYADLKNKSCKLLKQNFQGTMFYWELTGIDEDGD